MGIRFCKRFMRFLGVEDKNSCGRFYSEEFGKVEWRFLKVLGFRLVFFWVKESGELY